MSVNPFESPLASEPTAPRRTSATADFHPAHTLAVVTVVLLAVNLVLDLASVPSDMAQLELVKRIRAGQEFTQEEAESNDLRVQMLAIVKFAAKLTCGITFLIWIRRCHKNLPALGARGLQYTPGGAIGWWFVPIMHLFRPFQVMAEIWKASDPDYVGEDRRWYRAPGSTLMGFWWAAWLIDILAGQIPFSFRMHEGDIETSTTASIVSGLANVVTAALVIPLVLQIDRRQTAKHEKVLTMGEAPQG